MSTRLEDARIQRIDSRTTAEIAFVEFTAGKHGRVEMGKTEVFDHRGAPLALFSTDRPEARAYYLAFKNFDSRARQGQQPPEPRLEHRPNRATRTSARL